MYLLFGMSVNLPCEVELKLASCVIRSFKNSQIDTLKPIYDEYSMCLHRLAKNGYDFCFYCSEVRNCFMFNVFDYTMSKL